MKRVSVIVCTYNGEKYLKEQLDSILSQTRPADEIIIQDDGSTDNSVGIAYDYAYKHKVISVYKNESTKGVNPNFFSAMKRAQGEFILISDQDDIWLPNHIEWQLEAIGNHLLCSGISVPFPAKGYDQRIPNYHLLRTIYVGTLPGHTFMINRKLLSLIPDIDKPPLFRYYDAIITMVAAAYESIVYVEKPLVYHRMHEQSATFTRPMNHRWTLTNALRYIIKDIQLFREIAPKIRELLAIRLEYLHKIQSDSPILKDAITLLRLHSSKSIVDFIKCQLFCMRHCDVLFFIKEKKNLKTILRGAFFPISCSEYFRFLKD